ncbi:cytochrome C oxidase Cbb3 [Thioalkalivibrio denitrificans]|uniref:Cytochrome C oxidase Cbb3 n=1 Tax=Thioalkalivibrio denitrificans TaxID=108003 RepID=A0A1V3NKN8_9GAMM|nr:nitrite reductase [Thioalkalivibrio denitrificans]OOG25687.1 cytochrome C oxidase Cbb3 [Thioalkalivibrio denitrificans]
MFRYVQRHGGTGIVCALVFLLAWLPGSASADAEVKRLYQEFCASCHSGDRLGGMGPALLPENLRRLRQDEATKVIGHGRAATQMPGFAEQLSDEQIAKLVDYIYQPLPEMPVWGMDEMRESRLVHHDLRELGDQPRFDADPLNLFIVVELGDHHASLLDGDRLEVLTRFPTRYALHGGPKYSPDGRFVYFASRDGWISKFDVYNMKTVTEIRAGINTRNVAVSGDGRYLLVGNYLPHSAVLLDAADLTPIKIFDATDAAGTSSRVSAVYTAAPRGSFVVALRDVAEVWEISYLADADGEVETPAFPLRRIELDDYLDDFFFDPGYRHLIGAARNANNAQVVNLDEGRKVAELDLTGLPHLGSGISWEYRGRPVLATPNLREGQVSVIDMEEWKIIKRIDTLGPGFFMRSHGDSPYAWVDVFFGPDRDAVHIIDKDTLEIVRTLRPAPGKTAAHVEYDRHGRYAVLSIWDDDGAIVIYDGDTLEEVKRIPMKRPSGKYNVYNKTRLDPGTSH